MSSQEMNYKEEYRATKRKLKTLIYENEFFQEELRKAQRSLLRVQRDKSFLLDRILLYQQGPESSSDSEETEDSDNETTKDASNKRKRVSNDVGSSSSFSVAAAGTTSKAISVKKKKTSHQSTSNTNLSSNQENLKTLKKNNSISNSNFNQKKSQKHKGQPHFNFGPSGSGLISTHGCNATLNSINDVQMSREEIERTLAARQPITDFPTTVSLTLPHQLFSDNLLEGDFIGNDIDGSPSNLDEDVSIDNFD